MLNMTGGNAYMRNTLTGKMMPGKPMAGWTYGIKINLDFAAFSKDLDSPETAQLVPDKVLKQLKNFTDEEFSISSLFMDFQ
jgi:hypothetical protein